MLKKNNASNYSMSVAEMNDELSDFCIKWKNKSGMERAQIEEEILLCPNYHEYISEGKKMDAFLKNEIEKLQ